MVGGPHELNGQDCIIQNMEVPGFENWKRIKIPLCKINQKLAARDNGRCLHIANAADSRRSPQAQTGHMPNDRADTHLQFSDIRRLASNAKNDGCLATTQGTAGKYFDMVKFDIHLTR